MIGTRPMKPRSEPSDNAPGFCAKVPTAFSSLEEARNSMDYQWNTCLRLIGDMERYRTYEQLKVADPDLEVRRQFFSDIVKEWLSAFQAFLQKRGKSLDNKSLQAARTLEITHCFCKIYLELSTVNVMTDETAWDRFTPDHEHIVELASLIVKSNASEHISQKQGPEFCLDVNIVPPLYGVAHRCRDPVVRRKAISVLYAAPRQEGVWDSVLTARVAEKVMDIEEEGLGNVTCAADVPDWARLSDVDVKFDLQGRLGTVKYSRRRSQHEKVREALMETVEW